MVESAKYRRAWWAPLPLLLAGCLPFWAGSRLATVSGYPLRPLVLLTGTIAVLSLVLAAFAAREAFGPGAGRYPAWRWNFGKGPEILAYGFLGVAAGLGLLLQFLYRTGDLTIPLGALGVLGGYFCFAPPLKWHRRGLGEIAGALCFGLLPVVSGFYLQCGYWLSEEFFYGLPLTLAAFNLFLVYGFPDPQVEAPARHSLAARLTPVPAALIYSVANVLVMAILVALLWFPASPLPFRGLIWPLLLLAVVNQELVKWRAYREAGKLRRLGLLTLALHLGLGSVFCLMLWARW